MKSVLVSAAALSLAAGAAAAQQASQADQIIQSCRTEPNEAARIACLELAIYRLAGERPGDEAAVRPGETAAPQPAVPAAAAAATVSGIGAEQVQDRKADAGETVPERVGPAVEESEATVVAFARDPRGQLVLVMADGAIWAQRDSDDEDVSLVEGRTYSVEIEKGFISGYRMRFPDQQRILSVERLR